MSLTKVLVSLSLASTLFACGHDSHPKKPAVAGKPESQSALEVKPAEAPAPVIETTVVESEPASIPAVAKEEPKPEVKAEESPAPVEIAKEEPKPEVKEEEKPVTESPAKAPGKDPTDSPAKAPVLEESCKTNEDGVGSIGLVDKKGAKEAQKFEDNNCKVPEESPVKAEETAEAF